MVARNITTFEDIEATLYVTPHVGVSDSTNFFFYMLPRLGD